MEQIPIPRYIDSQQQLLIYEFDEAIIFFGFMGLGILIGGWALIASMAVGHWIVTRFQRYKNGAMDGILQHIVFWNGFMPLNKRYEDGMHRETFL
jgi:conjugal transfer pilus assembly protein TraL